jgi:hypothetical protein
VRNGDGDALRSPNRDAARFNQVAVASDGDLRGAFAAALVLHPICDRLRLTDNAEARRRDQRNAAVAFIRMTGDQRLHRRGKTQRCRVGGHVVDPAIGDHDDAGEPIGRDIGERRIERGEQARAVRLAVGFSSLDDAQLQSRNPVQPFQDLVASRLGLLQAVAEILTGALVDHDDRD